MKTRVHHFGKRRWPVSSHVHGKRRCGGLSCFLNFRDEAIPRRGPSWTRSTPMMDDIEQSDMLRITFSRRHRGCVRRDPWSWRKMMGFAGELAPPWSCKGMLHDLLPLAADGIFITDQHLDVPYLNNRGCRESIALFRSASFRSSSLRLMPLMPSRLEACLSLVEAEVHKTLLVHSLLVGVEESGEPESRQSKVRKGYRESRKFCRGWR